MMKQLIFIALLLNITGLAIAQKGTNYGKAVKTKKALSVPEFVNTMDTASAWTGVVTGKVRQVCKMEGCWLRLDDGSADGILVKMKDHSFTVPKDIEGKTVYVLGTANKSVTSVKMMQHYAEDAGKSKAEIEAITQPKTEVKLEAAGVKII